MPLQAEVGLAVGRTLRYRGGSGPRGRFLYFERRLLQRRVLLAERPAVEYDALRVPIGRVVVHHASRPPGIRPTLLSAMQLVRLFVPVWLSPEPWEQALRGTPISSGHCRDGRQTFEGLHLARRAGRTRSAEASRR